jgi:hypothetical protein
MTTLLEKAIAKLKELPTERQDAAAQLVLSVVGQDPAAVQLNAAQVAEIEARLGDSSPQYASHADVSAFFGKPAV